MALSPFDALLSDPRKHRTGIVTLRRAGETGAVICAGDDPVKRILPLVKAGRKHLSSLSWVTHFPCELTPSA
jgi:hypothetical protein